MIPRRDGGQQKPKRGTKPRRLPSAAGAKPPARSTKKKIQQALKDYHAERRSVDETKGYGYLSRGAEVGPRTGPAAVTPRGVGGGPKPGRSYDHKPGRSAKFSAALNPSLNRAARRTAKQAGALNARAAAKEDFLHGQFGGQARSVDIPKALRGREFGPRSGGRYDLSQHVENLGPRKSPQAGKRQMGELQRQGYQPFFPDEGGGFAGFSQDLYDVATGVPASVWRIAKASGLDVKDLFAEGDFSPERLGELGYESLEQLGETVLHPGRAWDQNAAATLLTFGGLAAGGVGVGARGLALGSALKNPALAKNIAYGAEGAANTGASTGRALGAIAVRGPDPGQRFGNVTTMQPGEMIPNPTKGFARAQSRVDLWKEREAAALAERERLIHEPLHLLENPDYSRASTRVKQLKEQLATARDELAALTATPGLAMGPNLGTLLRNAEGGGRRAGKGAKNVTDQARKVRDLERRLEAAETKLDSTPVRRQERPRSRQITAKTKAEENAARRRAAAEEALAGFAEMVPGPRVAVTNPERIGDYSRTAVVRLVQKAMDARRGGVAGDRTTKRALKTKERSTKPLYQRDEIEAMALEAMDEAEATPASAVADMIEGEGIPLEEAGLIRQGLSEYGKGLFAPWLGRFITDDISFKGLGKQLWREFNAAGRGGILFTSGSYIRNAPANYGFNVLEEGLAAPYNALKLARTRGTGLYGEIGEGMGQGKMRALSETDVPGVFPYLTTQAGRAFSHITDKPQRAQAFIHEAGRKGFNSPEELIRLWNDPELADLRDEILVRANKNMVDYGIASSGPDQFARDLILFWPWLKGSAAWGGRFAREHPVKTAAAAQLGQTGSEWAEEELGPQPSFMKGVFPVGERAGMPEVTGPMALNPLTTVPEAMQLTQQAFGPEGFKPGRAFELGEYLSPAGQAAQAILTRQDPFTHAQIPENKSAMDIAKEQLLDSITAKRLLERYGIVGGEPAGKGRLYPLAPGTEGFSPEFFQEFMQGPTTGFFGGAGRIQDPKERRELYASERADYASEEVKPYLKTFRARTELHRQAQKLGKLNPNIKRMLLDSDGRFKPQYRNALNRQASLTARYLRAGVKTSGTEEGTLANWRLKAKVAYETAKELRPELQNMPARHQDNEDVLKDLVSAYEDIIYKNALKIEGVGVDGRPLQLDSFIERYYAQAYPEEE